MPRSVVQLFDPAFEHVGGDDLADAFIAGGEERGAEHAEFVHEHGETSAVDDNRDRGAGAGLLEHVFIRAELRVRGTA